MVSARPVIQRFARKENAMPVEHLHASYPATRGTRRTTSPRLRSQRPRAAASSRRISLTENAVIASSNGGRASLLGGSTAPSPTSAGIRIGSFDPKGLQKDSARSKLAPDRKAGIHRATARPLRRAPADEPAQDRKEVAPFGSNGCSNRSPRFCEHLLFCVNVSADGLKATVPNGTAVHRISE